MSDATAKLGEVTIHQASRIASSLARPGVFFSHSSLSNCPQFCSELRCLSSYYSLLFDTFIMASSSNASQRVEEARALAAKDPSKAEGIYKDVLAQGPGKTESSSRDYENALVGLGQLYRDTKKPQDIAELIKTSRTAFSSFAKAKTAKLGKHYPGAAWEC